MKRIALEEHYTTAALADSFRSLAIGFDKETVARLVAGLSDFDGRRLEAYGPGEHRHSSSVDRRIRESDGEARRPPFRTHQISDFLAAR